MVSRHDNQSGRELDLRRAERLRTAGLLQGDRTPLTIIAVAEQATVLAEQAIQDAKREQPPPALACTEGCDWC
ncbi:MAG TPA: hypothetical protein VKU02_12985, partial [Gemmataceae bacterium]|nr:hypothetical protein [Gemmataceae bacterium]